MSINNNTSGLGDQENGTIGTRNFNDYTTREISSNISRYNYRHKMSSDQELAEFRNIVYKMVSGWAREDKIAQITEYGDASMLEKYRNPSNDDLNRILTESIIIHLDPEDLRKLRMDMMKKKGQVIKGISKANRNRKNVASKFLALNTKNFGDIYEGVKNSGGQDDYRKKLSKIDPSYKVPKYIERHYSNLRKELADVLRTCYNKVEITAIAFSMQIDIGSNPKLERIMQLIINKVCLYVDLIVGKSKLNYASSIIDPEPYDKLLEYTSYSYISGKPGLDPKAWAEKKRQARRAKVAIAERSKMMANKMRTKGRDVAAATGGHTASTFGSLAKKIRQNDIGILADASYEELAELAGKYGIDPTSKMNRDIGVLKAKIYNAMRVETTRISKLQKEKNRLTSSGKTTRHIDDLLSIHSRI